MAGAVVCDALAVLLIYVSPGCALGDTSQA